MYKNMLRLALPAIILNSSFAYAQEEDFITSFVAGKYLLIGQSPDSDSTYNGKVEIYTENDILKVSRIINGKRTEANGSIEPALNGDAQVLRIRFMESGINYEETCLIQADLDNYARLSCHWYQSGVKTGKAGLEALFIDHTIK
ncbi:hypothetical protein [Psychromonas ossibalaenae]|uniref:hypothetical protein n=1 Tax=Psychromonas ossibalaenae TaxID=444922 RepID=UPI00036BFBB6|nr:hypothetical protein [Psychromonas ossibalaenae]